MTESVSTFATDASSFSLFPYELILEIVKRAGPHRFLITDKRFKELSYMLLPQDPKVINPGPELFYYGFLACKDAKVISIYINHRFVTNLNLDNYPVCCGYQTTPDQRRIYGELTFSIPAYGHTHECYFPYRRNDGKDDKEHVLSCWLKSIMWISSGVFLRIFLEKTDFPVQTKLWILSREIHNKLITFDYRNGKRKTILDDVCLNLSSMTWLWTQLCDNNNTCRFDSKWANHVSMTNLEYARAMSNATNTTTHESVRFLCKSSALVKTLARLNHPVIKAAIQQHWHQLCPCLRASKEMQELVVG